MTIYLVIEFDGVKDNVVKAFKSKDSAEEFAAATLRRYVEEIELED